MSILRYKVNIEASSEVCYSPMNTLASQYAEELCLSSTEFYKEMRHTMVDYDYECRGGQPICHVLEWDGPAATEDDAQLTLPREERIYSQLRAMAAQEHTSWKLENFYIAGDGSVHLRVKNIDPRAQRDPNSRLWQADVIDCRSWQNFRIWFDLRSGGFVRGSYLIKRRRESHANGVTTMIEVTEQTADCLRRLEFCFDSKHDGVCKVMECRL